MLARRTFFSAVGGKKVDPGACAAAGPRYPGAAGRNSSSRAATGENRAKLTGRSEKIKPGAPLSWSSAASPRFALNLDPAAILVDDDVINDTKAQADNLAHLLGVEKMLKEAEQWQIGKYLLDAQGANPLGQEILAKPEPAGYSDRLTSR